MRVVHLVATLCRVALGDNNKFNLFNCWIAMTDNVFSLLVVPKVFEYLEHIEEARPREHFTNGNQ